MSTRKEGDKSLGAINLSITETNEITDFIRKKEKKSSS
jgi:hypothetical protein